MHQVGDKNRFTDYQCLVIVCTLQIGTNLAVESRCLLTSVYVRRDQLLLPNVVHLETTAVCLYGRIISVSYLFLVITHRLRYSAL
jgi:hypothetical protein